MKEKKSFVKKLEIEFKLFNAKKLEKLTSKEIEELEKNEELMK